MTIPPSVPIPPLDQPLPPFPGPGRPLDPAAPLVIAGRRAALTGSVQSGVAEVRVYPWALLREVRLDDADVLDAHLFAAGATRRLAVGGRVVHERLFVPRAGPWALIEWQASPQVVGSAPCYDPVDLVVSWTAPGDTLRPADPDTWPTGAERRVRVFHLPAGGVVALIASAAPQSWQERSLLVRLLPGEGFRLAVTAAPDERALAAAAAGEVTSAALVVARAGALRRLEADTARIDAPDPTLAHVLRSAVQRLDGFGVDLGGDSCPVDGHGRSAPAITTATAAHSAIALLAAGRTEPALETLRFLGARLDAHGNPPARLSLDGAERPGGPVDVAAYLLLATRALDWTGDILLLQSEWPRIRRALEALLGANPAAPPRRGLFEALTAAARAVGDSEMADQLAAALREPGRADEPPPGPDAGLTAFHRGRTTDGFRAWLDLARSGSGAPPSMWPGDGYTDAARPAAALVASLLLGWLGADADAARHRLRLRPQVPLGWTHFELEIPLGAARVRLRHTRDGVLHRFELEQERGPLPLRLVFEPVLPAAPIAGIRVDGAPASLDARPFGQGLLVPVQLILDAPRSVEVGVETPAPQ